MLDWSHVNTETIMIRMLTAAAVAILVASPARAGKVDVPADGEYTQACLPTVTCLWTIEQTGKERWKASFVALDNKPGGEAFCRYSMTLKPGVATFTNGDEFDALVGPIEKGQVGISGSPSGLLAVADVATCARTSLPRSRGGLGVNGTYEMIGD